MTQTIEINTSRLDFLLAIYNLSKDDLLSMLNEGRKRLYTLNDIYNETILLSTLKNIDKIFGKGILFYQDYSEVKNDVGTSVFFRKMSFETELNRESIRVVHQFETQKELIDAYAKLSQLSLKKKIDEYKVENTPRHVAQKVRSLFIPDRKVRNDREFLVSMIKQCAELNVFVFEHIEAPNKKDKVNIDGFFLRPNMIVLKRQKYSYKREIFSLAHEIGHCLLGVEEVESIVDFSYRANISAIEKWCNEFAFYLLLGESANEFDAIDSVDASNDYCFELVKKISQERCISRLAIYTQLLYSGKVTRNNYSRIREDLESQFQNYLTDLKAKYRDSDSHPMPPRPILSPLFVDTMQYALYKGVINEATFCEKLKVKKNELSKYIEW